ncbi:hypothetical protein BsIDN1_34390 [Bacillus safensis]|uniref:Glycosyl hydrolase family 30 beta sandwich domain-containing protein n=1 Tax=Bacillus safensis TaxID=561879 RepID=A0A5S9MA91_BACIA|nr:hypothetical protein BsIDN1_34390 [Bacillus safensis]
MTEVYYPNSDNNSADRWPEALGVSEHIHHSMVEGDFQAYVWWYIRRSYGPMKEDGLISKRGYNMAHFSKFVRPGYVRIDATKSPEPNVFVSAYKGNNQVVIVAINKKQYRSQSALCDAKWNCFASIKMDYKQQQQPSARYRLKYIR